MDCYDNLGEDDMEMVMEACGHCEEDEECWMMCFLENDPCYNWLPCMDCVDDNYEMDDDEGRDGDKDGHKGDGKGDKDGHKGGDKDGSKGGDGERDGSKGDGERDGSKGDGSHGT